MKLIKFLNLEKVCNKMKTNYFQTILLALIIISLITIPDTYAQKCLIKGSITDKNGSPLEYANVYIKNSVEGSMSNKKGEFAFKTSNYGTRILICSYIGFRTFQKEIITKPEKTISLKITLEKEVIKGKKLVITASSFTAGSDNEEKGVTLSALDVVRTPGSAADIFWAIKSFPGLQQVEEGAGLFVRGGDVSETAFYLDGALLQHPYKYESPTGGFFGTFSPFLLKGTYFSIGGFSAEYGNALSGVLAMQSRDLPSQFQYGIGLGLAAESAFITVPIIDDTFGFSFSGNLSNTKMMFDLNDCKKIFSHYPSSFDLNFNCVYKPNKNSKFKMFIFREDDKVGVEVEDPEFSTHFYGNGSNRLYNLLFTTLLGDNILIKTNTALSRYIKNQKLGVMDLDLEDRFLQIRFEVESKFSHALSVKSGIELYQFKTLVDGTVPVDKENVDPYALSQKVDTDYTSNRRNYFIQGNFLTPLGFKIIPGLRGEYESITDKNTLDPRISFILPLTLNTTITAAYGIYHQFPSPLYYDPFIGNSKLSEMKSVHKVIGFNYKRKNTIFRVEAYYKGYKNLLLEDESINYTNQGKGFSKGIDLFLKERFKSISGWISYSWLKSRRKWMDLPIKAPPYFDITHNFNTVVTAELSKSLSLGIRYRYATGKPYTSKEGVFHNIRVPAYKKMDINFSWMHSFFENDMTIIYFAVSNVLGRINIFDYKYSSDFQKREAVTSSFQRSYYFGFQINI